MRPILAVLRLAYLMVPVALAVKAAHLLGGAGWVLAYGLFLLAHGPMLLRPRVDAIPG